MGGVKKNGEQPIGSQVESKDRPRNKWEILFLAVRYKSFFHIALFLNNDLIVVRERLRQ